MVTIGTTLGMLFSDGLAVLLGEKFAAYLMAWVRRFAATLFVLFGFVILWKGVGM